MKITIDASYFNKIIRDYSDLIKEQYSFGSAELAMNLCSFQQELIQMAITQEAEINAKEKADAENSLKPQQRYISSKEVI